MRSIQRSANGQQIVINVRRNKCIHIPPKKVMACGEDATHFYLYDGDFPICFCDEHDEGKFGEEERYLKSENLGPCTEDEFSAAVFLNM